MVKILKGAKIMMKEKLKICALFSGVGFQERGIENSGLYEVESVATSDIDINAIISYAAIHCGMTPEMVENYEYPSRQEMADYLSKLNIGYDFKKEKEYNWQKKVNGKDKILNKAWLACKLQNNLGDVSKIEHLPECDMLIYSSPCQSFSIAGTLEGTTCTCRKCGYQFNPFEYDVDKREICPSCGSDEVLGTRSGQLLEVERLLLDMRDRNILPKFTILENVDALVGKKFKADYDKWCERLERIGYKNYWEVMNTKYTGIPQNRNRVYLLSVRNNIDASEFKFPVRFDTGVRLKDVLQENVDEKYYIKNQKAENLLKDLILSGKLNDYAK